MSGSPICQNGKLVGVVTYVLINDSTMGYGIFIENMLNAAEKIVVYRFPCGEAALAPPLGELAKIGSSEPIFD